MATSDAVLAELQSLLSDLEGDVQKAERRIAAAQAARDALLRQLAAVRETVDLYRQRNQLPAPELAMEVDEATRHRWAHGQTRDMAVDIARLNGGVLRVKAAAQLLAQAGMFKDKDNAASNLYAAIGRSPGLFEKVRPGEYVLHESPGEPAPDALALALTDIEPPPAGLVPFRPAIKSMS